MVDERIRSLRDSVISIVEWKRSKSIFTAKLNAHTEAMFEFLKRLIGTKPRDLPSELDGSSLWNVIENFASRFKNLDKEIKDTVASELMGVQASNTALQKQLNLEIGERKFINNYSEDLLKKFATRINNGEKITMVGLNVLKKEIIDLNNKINQIYIFRIQVISIRR